MSANGAMVALGFALLGRGLDENEWGDERSRRIVAAAKRWSINGEYWMDTLPEDDREYVRACWDAARHAERLSTDTEQ